MESVIVTPPKDINNNKKSGISCHINNSYFQIYLNANYGYLANITLFVCVPINRYFGK